MTTFGPVEFSDRNEVVFHNTPIVLDAPPAPPERRPGDFRRDANGTPWVSHPDGERTKPKRKGDGRAEAALIALYAVQTKGETK